MHDKSFATDFAQEALKGAPPVAVTATTLAGLVDWQTSVLILTAIYLLLQIFWLGWKAWDRAVGRHRPGD